MYLGGICVNSFCSNFCIRGSFDDNVNVTIKTNNQCG